MKRKGVIVALFCLLLMLCMNACSDGVTIDVRDRQSTREKKRADRDEEEEEDEEDDEEAPPTESRKKKKKKTAKTTEIETTEESIIIETYPQPQETLPPATRPQETLPPATQPQPTLPPATQPQPTQAQVLTTLYVVNCRESITLRTSPSTSASEIRQIPLGAAVSFMENASNGFYKVAYMGNTGYALASYLSESPYDHYTVPATTAADDSFTGIVVNCKQSITLRRVPSTSGAEILQIPLGSLVTVYGRADNGFYYVYYGGYDGYALASYIDPY